MAGDDLVLIANIKAKFDETSLRAESQKAGGLMAQILQSNFGKGFVGGALGRNFEARTAAGQAGVAAGVVSGLALLGTAVIFLKKIFGAILEQSGFLRATMGLFGTGLGLILGAIGNILARVLLPIAKVILTVSAGIARILNIVAFGKITPQTATNVLGLGGQEYGPEHPKNIFDFYPTTPGTSPLQKNIDEMSDLMLRTSKESIASSFGPSKFSSFWDFLADFLQKVIVEPTRGILNKILPSVYADIEASYASAESILAAANVRLAAAAAAAEAARLAIPEAYRPAGTAAVINTLLPSVGATEISANTAVVNPWGYVGPTAFTQRPAGWTQDYGWIPTIASMESFANAYHISDLVASTGSNIYGGRVGFSAAQGYLANLQNNDPATIQALQGMALGKSSWDFWQALGMPPLYDPNQNLTMQQALYPGGMMKTAFDQLVAGTYTAPTTTAGLVESSLGLQGLLEGIMRGDLSGIAEGWGEVTSPWYSSLGSTPQAALSSLQETFGSGFGFGIKPEQISVNVYIGDLQLRDIIRKEIELGNFLASTAVG